MYRHKTLAEACQTLPRDGVGLQVPVDTDEHQVLEPLQQRLGVAAHAQGSVNHVGGSAFLHGTLNAGCQQVDAAVQHDGHVALAGVTFGKVVDGGAGDLHRGAGGAGFGGAFYAHGCSCVR